MKHPMIPPEDLEALRRVYSDFDRAFNRTRSRAAVDGGILLLAIVDELMRLREVVESQKDRT